MANRRERRAAGKAARTQGIHETGVVRESAAPASPALTLRAQALDLYRKGRLVEAERAYQRLLREKPSDPQALFQYGVLKGERGELGIAATYLTEAAVLLPHEPAIHHALGLVRTRQRRFAEAALCHDRALALDPAHPGALLGRGEALHQLGNLAAAEASYRRAAQVAPESWEVRFGLATALADLGRLSEATDIYRELVRARPHSAEAHFNLGCVLRDLGRHAEAAALFERAVTLRPELGHMVIDLVAALCEIGRFEDALDRAAAAMRRKPQTVGARLAFAAVIGRLGELDYRPELSHFLAQCFDSDDIEHEDLAAAVARQLVSKHGLSAAPEEAAAESVGLAITSRGAVGCLADPLLHLLLMRAVNYNLILERFLTEVRRRLVLADTIPRELEHFLAALALQAWNNGYVFAVSEEETRRVKSLKAQIEAELPGLAGLTRTFGQKLLRFSLYAPLTDIVGAARVLALSGELGSAPVDRILERCLKDPLEETELARDLPSLGNIADPVSREVRAQYEEHPYPRWFGTPPLSPVSLPVMLCRKFPHLAFPSALAGPIEILVAGCGTGRQPIGTALSFAEARVLAVDLSRASLAYASRMVRRLGVGNVSFLHADLLQLGELGRCFPVIEAVGVLHHMTDPLAGWRVLTDLLLPGGFMRIGLYSALARSEVVAARELIAQLGLSRSAEDIRRFRQSVLFGTESQRLRALARSKDIYDLNGCRDLLFHAKEHRFTLAEVECMLAALELEFVGFEFAADAIPLRYRAKQPEAHAMTDLTRWARFEEAHPDVFSGMYIFWCRKREV